MQVEDPIEPHREEDFCPDEETSINYRKLLVIPAIAITNLAIAAFFFFKAQQYLQLKLSLDIENIKSQSKLILESLKKDSSALYPLLGFYSSVYLFFQIFSIPGTIALNLIAGASMGLPIGLILTVLLTVIGSVIAYFVAKIAGKDLIQRQRFVRTQIQRFNKNLTAANYGHKFLYMLSLRMFPLVPNWVLNYACPQLDIDFPLFAMTCLIGVIPFNYVTVNGGLVLSNLTSIKEVLNLPSILMMVVLSVVLVVPTFLPKLMHRLKLTL